MPDLHRHPDEQSDDFRAGVAHAAHYIRHMVSFAHGHSGWVPPLPNMGECCRQEILNFAIGTVVALEEAAGVVVDHEH